MRCIECEEIELARVRDQRPAQTLPDPVSGAGRLPGRDVRRAALTRRRLMQWGVAGARVGLRRQGARLRAGLGVRRGGGRRRRTRSASCCSTSRAATTASTSSCPAAAPTTRLYVDARARPSIAARAPTPDGRDRLVQAARARRARTGVRQRDRLRRRQQRRHGRLRHALRRRHRRSGLGSGDHPGSRLQPAEPARTSRAVTTGSLPVRSRQLPTAGWVAGSTPTASKVNPLQAVSLDSNLSKQIRSSTAPPAVRAPSPAASRASASRRPGRPTGRHQQRGRQARCRAVRGRQRCPSPARAGIDGPDLRRRREPPLGAQRRSLPASAIRFPNSGLSQKPFSSRPTLLGSGLGTRIITIDWGSFDTHGDPARRAGSASSPPCRVPWLRSRPTSRPARRRAEPSSRWCSRSSAAASRSLPRLPRNGHRPRLGRPDHAQRAPPRQGRPRGRLAGLHPVQARAARARPSATPTRATCRSPTDYRSVYMSVLKEWLGGDDPAEPDRRRRRRSRCTAATGRPASSRRELARDPAVALAALGGAPSAERGASTCAKCGGDQAPEAARARRSEAQEEEAEAEGEAARRRPSRTHAPRSRRRRGAAARPRRAERTPTTGAEAGGDADADARCRHAI